MEPGGGVVSGPGILPEASADMGDIKDVKQWGRDHHPYAFTIWMTGGGIKPGITHGAWTTSVSTSCATRCMCTIFKRP